ncbi:MAG: glutamine synthetase [bacterium]|nr:glutamine synthetase [bacterium]
MTTPHDPNDVLRTIEQSDSQKVKVAASDIDGVLRGKFLHKDKFLPAAKDGFGFCDVVFGWDCDDVCYDNVTYTGWHTGYPDAQARVDLTTHRQIPWEDNLDFFLCDFQDATGGPLPVCPRQALKGVVDRVRKAGFDPKVGFEFEWFNFRETPQTLAAKGYTNLEPLTPGMFGYSVLRSGQEHEFFHALMDQLAAFRVPIEGLHTETGPGTYEASILCSDAMEAADRALLFKSGVKQIAYAHGIVASFMARWNTDLSGCGGHIHQSLTDPKNGANLFFDPAAADRMSPLFKHYLAGQMQCLPELLPFFAPTVNSYKRLVEGYWAPTAVTWGYDNRTVCFRALTGSEKAARVESRVAGADINPYLALAASLASGLYGIEHELELTEPPVLGNAYDQDSALPLARDLGEATEALRRSERAREILGDALVDHFVNTRLWEWRRFQKATTDWELKRYFEIT